MLILTSNIGAGFLVDPALTPEQKRELVLAEVRTRFKPEFLNRLDEIVLFDALSKEALRSIVDIQLEQLAQRLASRRLNLTVSDSAKAWLAERGYDPAYGARPLRRLIQQAIGDRLAKELLAGYVRDGDTVAVDVADGGESLSVDAVQ